MAYLAPVDWDQKQLSCDALPVTRTEYAGRACIKSYWKPNAEELLMLKNGAHIALVVIGNAMPPVCLTVEK